MNIKERLIESASKYPDFIKFRINSGDRISLNLSGNSFVYEIDDPEIYKELGSFNSDLDFYLQLHILFETRNLHHFSLFPPNGNQGPIVTPFSTAVRRRIGECLEKALLIQLAKQDNTDTFFVKGLLKHESMRGVIPHAFNIVYYDGNPFLIDAENPMIVINGDKRTTVPYFVPVIDFDGIKFEIDSKSKAGRTYSLDQPRELEELPRSLFDLLVKF